MAKVESMQLKIELPEALGFFLASRSRYKVAYGGRGSGKSWGAARALLALAMSRKVRILCTREIQKSIKDSVHRLFGDQIEALGLSAHFTVLRDEIRCSNGSQFLFTGLGDKTADTIKSFEGVDYCWVEEAQTVSERSWSILIPTIRAHDSEIWVTFNPDSDEDPTYQRFVVNPPPGAGVVKVNWDANPWFPEVLRVEKDHLYSVDPEAADWIWGGNTRRMSDAQVLRGRYVVESFEPGEAWDGPYQGADWGFATDPTVLVRVWIHERKLYVEHEAYGLGTEIDFTPALFDSIEGARNYVTRADSSRPETISYMNRNGWRKLSGCYKWPGSVEDGVEHLRAYDQIVIHPRCVQTAQEARLYSFKVDRLSGDVLPQLVDQHNHCMDAIRYALEPVILGKKKRPTQAPKPYVHTVSTPQAWMA